MPPTCTIGFYGKSGTGKSHNLLQVLRGLSRLPSQMDAERSTQTHLELSAIECRGLYNSMQPDTYPLDLLSTSSRDTRLEPDFRSKDGLIPGLWGSSVVKWRTGEELDAIVDQIDQRRTTSRTAHNPRSSRKHVVYLLVSNMHPFWMA